MSFILMTSCNDTEYHLNPGSFSQGVIKGRVTESYSGNHLSNVGIITEPLTSLTMTDMNGEYIISDVTLGTYTITANKQGYLIKSSNIVVCGDTVIANFSLDEKSLSPGDARIDGEIDGIDWAFYSSSGSCKKLSNDIKISSSFSLGSNSYSMVIYISNPIGLNTLNLGPTASSYVQYDRNLYGDLDFYTTKTQGGSGEVEITYLSLANKTIKGKFNTIMVEIGSSYNKKSAHGSFKGTWQ